MADAFVAYVHYLGMMCMLAALVVEYLLLAGDLDQGRARQLVNADLAAGTHQISWDGKDQSGRAMAAGVYLYRLEAAAHTLTRRMTLVK